MIDHAAVFRSLAPVEKKVLRGVEQGMKGHEWVPVEDIAALGGLSRKEVEYRINDLVDKDLVERFTQFYVGYQLKFNGYDILAIDTFVSRNTITALGGIIGVGKESVVIAAMGACPLAVKFHREGQTSFRRVKRARQHLVDIDAESFSWLFAAKLAARREHEALKRLYPQVSVPEPVDYNRHAIVMSVVQGVELAYAKVLDPEWYLDEILAQIKRAYDLGLVHSDLSEYNVLARDEGITLIDWPQYVAVGSKTAGEMLARDVGNILTYFERKYRITRDLSETLEAIRG